MPMRRSVIAGVLLIAGMAAGAMGDGPSFATDVRPILVKRCFLCHGPDVSTRKADLRLDERELALAVSRRRPDGAFVPGDPDHSLLLERIASVDPDERMPPAPQPPLTASEIETLRAWIADGAPYEPHWSWQPVRDPSPPPVRHDGWVRDPLDRFVLARLEAADLAPAPAADPAALLRRLHLDLVGLPPDATTVSAFLADPTDAAYDAQVEALLASPAFGEHWARRWLDLVRYAETCGHEFDYPIPNAWRYRDYVVRAFNADVPYDQLLREHLAGDLLPAPRRRADGANESVVGTAFWNLAQGTHAPVDVRQDEAERVANQIEVFGKAFLGATLSCARCHDHKFDPITAEDYAAMAGFIRSSRRVDALLDPTGAVDAAVAALRAARDAGDAACRTALGSDAPPPAAVPTARADVGDDRVLPPAAAWFRTGAAFAEDARPGAWFAGEGVLRLSDRVALHGGLLGRRLEGSAQSPTFAVDRSRLHLRVRGAQGRVRLVIDGYVLHEYNALLFDGLDRRLDAADWTVVTMDLSRFRHTGDRAYLELLDDGPGWIALDAAVLSDDPDGVAVLARCAPAPDPASPLAALARHVDAGTLPAALIAPAAEFVSAVTAIDDAVPAPERVPTLRDGTPEDEFVFLRGDPHAPGPRPPRAPVRSLSPDFAPITDVEGSGRRRLAEALLAPSHPLVARVAANRLWHHLTGRGIVATTDDFGGLGALPTHPDLLDHLASDLRTDWSMKRVIRRIVRSATYRQSVVPADPAAAAQRDPANELLSRMRVRRLSGEQLRDALLVVGGELDRTPGGPPVPVHLTEYMTGRGRPGRSGPLDGDRRRSIYLEVRRNFLVPMLQTFDAPVPATCVGRRHESNLPAQALILMNDPFVHEMAARWGRALDANADGASVPARIDLMHRAALGRPATDPETSRAAAFLADAGDDADAWAELALALFNAKAFSFVF